MEVEDVFDEWDGNEMMDMEEIESSVGHREENISKKCEKGQDSEGETGDSADEYNDEGNHLLRCKKCRKIYRSKSWFLKHQSSCDGTSKTAKNHRRGSQHQIRTRELLTGLAVDEYFETNGLPAILKLLK